MRSVKEIFSNNLRNKLYEKNATQAQLAKADWNILQEQVKRNIKYSSKSRVYLFSGLLKCPYCQRRLGGIFDGSSKRYRRPKHYYDTCPMSHTVSEKKLESWLLKNIESDFKVKVTQKPKRVKKSPKVYKDRLKRLNDIYLMGNISEAEYKTKSTELQRVIADLSKEPPQKTITFTANWKDLYQKLDDEHKRSFWRNLIKEVKIDESGAPVEILY